jgi:hypothetical protein
MNPGLYRTVDSVPLLTAPPNYPGSHILGQLPEGVKIKSDAYGTERDGYAHVYAGDTNTEGWIAVQFLTPYEDSVREPPPVATKPPIARPTSPSTTASLTSSGVDWGTVAKVGVVAVGIIAIAGGTVYYLKKRRRRR